jgi:hypothetical protein
MTREGMDPLLDLVVIKLKEIEKEREEQLENLESDEFVYIKFENKEDEITIENPAIGV